MSGMRTIKFRAWNGKTLTEPFDLSDIANAYDIGYLARSYEFNEVDVVKEGIILEQFTGLKDKNGKEIYEGDIVRCGANEYGNPGKVYKVVYSRNAFVYVRDDEPDQTSYYGLHITEVIGNVHEHSDLIV